MKGNVSRKSAPRFQGPEGKSSADSSLKRQQRETDQNRGDAQSGASDSDRIGDSHTKNVKKDPDESSSRRRNELFWCTISLAIGISLDIIIFNEDASTPTPNRAINYLLVNLPMIMVLWKYEVSKLFKDNHSERSKEAGSLAQAASEDQRSRLRDEDA